MGHSYTQLCYHLVFCPKYRRPVIKQAIELQVWGILREVCEYLGLHVFAIGGYDDHVHIVVAIPAHLAIADVVRMIKCNSSRMIKERIAELMFFSWQSGYGAFTFRRDDVDVLIRYVKKQRQHHS